MKIQEKLQDIVSYEYSKEEKILYPLFSEYLKNKYDLSDIYKFRFYRGDKSGTIGIYIRTEDEIKKFWEKEDRDERRYWFPTDSKKVLEMVHEHALNTFFDVDVLNLSFECFESDAIQSCYASSFEEFKTFKMKYFNPDTMERILPNAMFVVYKSKELMELAEKNGEQARIREDYYRFIKKYDTFNFVTPEKHFLVHFDYSGHARSDREYFELSWEMM